jgi:hypothetical protein
MNGLLIFFTVFVVSVAITTVVGVSLLNRGDTLTEVAECLTKMINPPFDPYPERPIDKSRYRISDDDDLQMQERMRQRSSDDEFRLYKIQTDFSMNELKHIDGVPWWKAELPPPNHRCWPQTDAWIGLRQVQRCACGAIRESDYPEWARINERKPKDKT